jgi:hypothetical protein
MRFLLGESNMGRRRDYKPDPNIKEIEATDPHTRQPVKVVTISASTYFSHATKDVKMKSKWPSQIFSRQRGKRSRIRKR